MNITTDEAVRELSMHLMQCGSLMPIEWVTSHGPGSRFMKACEMALDALKEQENRSKWKYLLYGNFGGIDQVKESIQNKSGDTVCSINEAFRFLSGRCVPPLYSVEVLVLHQYGFDERLNRTVYMICTKRYANIDCIAEYGAPQFVSFMVDLEE